MDESLCSIEILRRGKGYVAKLQTEMGGEREIKGKEFEDVMRQLSDELMEEFGSI